MDFKELSLDFLPDLLEIYPYTMLHLCGKVAPHLEANIAVLRDLPGLNMIYVGVDVDLTWLKEALLGEGWGGGKHRSPYIFTPRHTK